MPLLALRSSLTTSCRTHPESMCPVDAKNDAVNGAAPTPVAACACSGTGQAKQFDQLLAMHSDLISLVGALIEQNEQMLQALSDGIGDDYEPTSYLDGTKVS